MDNTALVNKVNRWYQSSVDYFKDWREKAKESQEFREGKQWSDEDIEILNKQNRPALTFNKILPSVNAVVGYQKRNRLDVIALPRGGQDQLVSDIMTNAIRFVRDITNGEYEISDAFLDTVDTGMGWLKTFIDRSENPEGDPAFEWVPWDEIYPGPFKKADGSDMKRCQHIKWFYPDEARALYPNVPDEFWTSVKSILDSDQTVKGKASVPEKYADGTSLDWMRKEDGTIRIIETWWIEKQVVTVEQQGQQSNLALDVVKFVVTAGNQIIQDPQPSPFRHRKIPFIPIVGFRGTKTFFGVIEALKDPQREKNKRRSQLLNIINRMPNGTWRYPEGSIDVELWKREGPKPGAMLPYKPGFEPKPNDMPSPPAAIFEMESRSDFDMKEISGVNNALLGIAEGSREPGVAVNMRQQQGITTLVTLFDNLRLSHKALGSQLISLIQQVYGPERLMRVVDDPNLTQYLMTPEGQKIVYDAASAKYNLVLEEVSVSASSRQEAFTQFNTIFQTITQLNPQLGAALLPEFISASDLPNKNAILRKIDQVNQAAAQAAPPSLLNTSSQPLNQIGSQPPMMPGFPQ